MVILTKFSQLGWGTAYRRFNDENAPPALAVALLDAIEVGGRFIKGDRSCINSIQFYHFLKLCYGQRLFQKFNACGKVGSCFYLVASFQPCFSLRVTKSPVGI